MTDSIKFVPPVPSRVFEDRTGLRLRKFTIFTALLLIVMAGFAIEFAIRVYNLTPTIIPTSTEQNRADGEVEKTVTSDTFSIALKENANTDCGQSLIQLKREPTGIAGYVPFDDSIALAGLRAHCSDLDSVYYQAFSFGTDDGYVAALGENGAKFPLPEFHSGRVGRNRPVAYPIIVPIVGTSPETLEQLFNQPASRSILKTEIERLDLAGVDGGLCIDLSEYPDINAVTLLSAFEWLDPWLQNLGLRSCLIGNINAEFWAFEPLSEMVDQSLMLGFQFTQNPFDTIAMQSWFENSVGQVAQTISPDDRSYGLGSFSTVWKSGERNAERIPFVEAMLRANEFDATVNFDADTGNTRIRYLDNNRRLNQVWTLDAVSFYNQRKVLDDKSQVTIWPLGYEDPAIWNLANESTSNTQPIDAIEATIDLSNYVAVDGVGPFSAPISLATPGVRRATLDQETQLIVSQTYTQIPSPQRIRFFGKSADLELAVTFNGVGNARETEVLLDLLALNSIRATFFLSTQDLLFSGAQIQDLLAAGHTIGAATVPRNSRSQISRTYSIIENNLPQHLLQHKFGHLALLVRNPSRYGQFPGDMAILEQLQGLQIAGYLPVFSNFAAPSGKFDPLTFVDRVSSSALDRPANVLSFDFSRQNDSLLNNLLPEVLQNLNRVGFRFTTLPKIAGLQPEDVFPVSDVAPTGRDQITYSLMTITWLGVQNLIFLLALIVALRSPVYLFFAFLRREKFAFDDTFRPPITVIIPAFNEERVIGMTIESVLASDYPNLKIIIVDDGSSDGTAEVAAQVASSDPRVTLTKQENHGKWYAIDSALEVLETEIFVSVDADTLLQKDAIKYLVQPFRDERVGAVSGTVEIGNRDNIITACQMIEYKISQHVMRRAYEVFNGILVVPGAIGAWRADAVIKSGYVSGDTVTEDADLTVAVHRADYKVMYAPEALSYTEAPNSVNSFMRQRLRWSLGMLQVAWKHKGAIIEGYAVGFISIVDAVWYRVISSFVYPIVDLIVIGALVSWSYSTVVQGYIDFDTFSTKVVFLFAILTILDIANLAAAFWFEKKFEWKLLLLVPFLRLGYRQMLYISSMRSLYHALSGRLSGWNKLIRTGTATMPDEQKVM